MSVINREINSPIVAQGFFAGAVADIRANFAVWRERIALRRELAELSFRDIQEIGLDQAEVDREASKPFWRA